ncbi:MAG: nucleotidyltransferase family protein [Oligoflexia bacterium]|nr:nucleotidyltransferase family protein [Oligoflexia bacterium]
MKAVILAGGRGRRLNQYSEDRNKCMLLFGGIPLIEHSLRHIEALPIPEIIIVVGYRAEDIINHYGINYNGKKIRYVIQREQRGLVHALECCQESLEDHDFMLFLGDEIMIDPYHREMLSNFYDESAIALCGVVRVEDRLQISKTYSVVVNHGLQIFRLIEKPKHPANDLMGTGNCIFKNKIFSYIAQTPINQVRLEKELPDLIQCAIDDGQLVKAFPVCKQYVNINSEDDISIIQSRFGKNIDYGVAL